MSMGLEHEKYPRERRLKEKNGTIDDGTPEFVKRKEIGNPNG